MTTATTSTLEQPMLAAPKEYGPHWTQFDRLEGLAADPPWVRAARRVAMAHFAEVGLPTLQDEDWRFTNVAPIARLPFRPAIQASLEGVGTEALHQSIFGGVAGPRLVFVDGHFAAALSSPPPRRNGIEVGSLATALATGSAWVERHLFRQIKPQMDSFAALNAAFFRDGAFLFLPAAQVLEQPLHLVFIATGHDHGAACHPRNLLIADRHSQLTVVESYLSLGNAPCVTNAATEMVLGEGAIVEHCKVQDESPAAFHVATSSSRLERGANLLSHSIVTGARLCRNNIRTVLAGEGSECILNGVYLSRGDQLADHHMVVEHAQPHGASHEYFNGILAGRAKGVFHGRILVHPGAQKTVAKQTNKNLLLSDEATIDTKPQLEIYADDVKCTHGATVGQLDANAIFYLRARGVGLETARRMLIHAFAGEIIARIRCEPVRETLDRVLWDRVEQSSTVAASAPAAPPKAG